MLEAAHGAAKKMTTHENADTEIRELKKRYDVVKAVADSLEARVDVLLKEWVLLDTTVFELNSWVAKVMLVSHWSILLILSSHWSGEDIRGGKPVLPREDGVHPGGAQEYLQGKREVGG